ncbi:SURF1 family protein [Nocardioides immobilis]|uniref:SURF1 family cytochrome oxidase biogenesis protein n=1 Tax=Nocardioides immobilis TaxID=2049295 RepID=UPI001FE295C5|nr:SURF1 family protein [Nocardioides immobilis]
MGDWLVSWRFLLSRRWLLFFLAIIVLAVGTWWLGEWQFGRLDDRRARNEVIEANAHDDPVPVDDVLAEAEPVATDEEYTVIEATGTYAVDDTLLVRYRTRDSAPGMQVVVPLITADGTALVVDRGWAPEEQDGTDPLSTVPEPPAGEVTITGWVRADGEGDSTEVSAGGMRAIASEEVGKALDLEVYGGFVELLSEDPAPEESLEPPEDPDTGQGPHFFYGLQWWFFGVLALGGFGYLAWDERKHGPRGLRASGSSRRRRGPSPH